MFKILFFCCKFTTTDCLEILYTFLLSFFTHVDNYFMKVWWNISRNLILWNWKKLTLNRRTFHKTRPWPGLVIDRTAKKLTMLRKIIEVTCFCEYLLIIIIQIYNCSVNVLKDCRVCMVDIWIKPEMGKIPR